jgi:hypothetical protein
MVSWLHCFGDCHKAEYHGKKAWWRKVAHLMMARKERERDRYGGKERLGTRYNPQGHIPKDPLLSTRPHL